MIKNIFFRSHDFFNKKQQTKKIIFILFIFLVYGGFSKTVLAQTTPNPTSVSVLYVPLIGISSVPDPLALPNGSGNVTYNYAVKNFLSEIALSDIKVTDDKCSPVKYVTGDDNGDGILESTETWRYTCTTNVSKTTQSIATATGMANDITATHKAYDTVIVGSNTTPPLVSIVNITKVAYPLSLPAEGGEITYTYRVNNPGIVPLSNVQVTDDKCSSMSGRLGDTNGNNLLDPDEVWIYTCSTILTHTTTNTATVTAFGNGLKAIDNVTVTVNVATPVVSDQSSPQFPNTGEETNGVNPSIKIVVWTILSVILAILIILFIIKRKSKLTKTLQNLNPLNQGQKQ
jgi:hypothetical protein